MASRGPKPIPSHLKMVKGTAQKCRTNKAEPKPATDNIQPPEYLSGSARKQWRVVSKQLAEAGVLTNMDVDALALYCEAFARYREAVTEIDDFGPITRTPSGFPVQSPWLQIANKAFEQMTKLLAEFGMTPSARSRVRSTKKPDDGDEWDEF